LGAIRLPTPVLFVVLPGYFLDIQVRFSLALSIQFAMAAVVEIAGGCF
jgi:hypothetical protein